MEVIVHSYRPMSVLYVDGCERFAALLAVEQTADEMEFSLKFILNVMKFTQHVKYKWVYITAQWPAQKCLLT